MAHIDTESEREPSADDFGAAEKVLARLMPSLEPGTLEYRDKRQALGMLRARCGKDMFELRYGLRSPKNSVEQAEADFVQERITQEQLAMVLKADAERPLDIEMLDAFHEAFEKRLMAYSRMLQAVIAIVTDQREHEAWRRREAEVDSHVEEMQKKLPLWKEQVGTIIAFLAEIQAERKGEPVRCGDRLAESAHMLACQVMNDAVAFWRSSKEIAHRSRTDPNYLYATSASKLFYESHLPGLPPIKDIRALMVLEYVRARKALQEQGQSTKSAPPPPEALAIPQELRVRLEHDAKEADGDKETALSVSLPTESAKRQEKKHPEKDEIEAYKLYTFTQVGSQQQVADMMNDERRTSRYTQPWVCRAISRVKKFVEAGGVLPKPEAPPNLESKPMAVPNEIIDMGKNPERRVKRQREERNPDDCE